MKVLRYAPSSNYLLQAWTMKQLSPRFLVWFLDHDWTKQMAQLKIQLSTILDSSSLRMWTYCALVMQWNCSDHWLIFCGLEPWSSYLSGPWSVHWRSYFWTMTGPSKLPDLRSGRPLYWILLHLKCQPIVQWLCNESAQICTIIDLSFAG